MHIGGQRRELRVQRAAGRSKLALAHHRDGPGAQPLRQLERIPHSTLDYVGKRDLVPGKQTANRRLNQRRREAGKDGGGTAEDALIKYLRLSKIGYFGGPTYISGS